MDLGERIKNKAFETDLDVASIKEKASVTSHGSNVKGRVRGKKSQGFGEYKHTKSEQSDRVEDANSSLKRRRRQAS